MEPSLTSGDLARARARIAFARLLQTVGWAGLAGIGLACAALIIALSAWSKQAATFVEGPAPRPQAMAAVRVTGPAPEAARIRLPRREDVPMLLTRIERAAVGSGLPWTSGDYRIVPASDHQAASLEVRCAFKAPYPKLRAMVAEVLGAAPMVTFREMTFTRAAIDAPDVDARFAIAVFLADEDDRSGRVGGER